MLDSDWVAVFKNSSESCLQQTTMTAYKYQESLNFTKEECDVSYGIYIKCLITISKLVSKFFEFLFLKFQIFNKFI